LKEIDFDGLNSSQRNALVTCINNKISLILGPPGTGKTHTMIRLVEEITKTVQGSVLLATPTNQNADLLARRLTAVGISCLRVNAANSERTNINQNFDTLYKRITESKISGDDLPGIQKIIKEYPVLITTCANAVDPRLSGLCFHNVVIDEAARLSELETLIPASKSSCRLVLVGDSSQLGPIFLDRYRKRVDIRTSLFERFRSLGFPMTQLDVQYRMPRGLNHYTGRFYRQPVSSEYSGHLDNPVRKLGWWSGEVPISFVNTVNHWCENEDPLHVNSKEAFHVVKNVAYAIRQGVAPEQIAVLAPYHSQLGKILCFIRRYIPQYKSRLTVQTIDSFQGSERDLVFLSLTRENSSGSIGFLNDFRRLNVALTRQREGLVIFGNRGTLEKNENWSNFLHYLRCTDSKIFAKRLDAWESNLVACRSFENSRI